MAEPLTLLWCRGPARPYPVLVHGDVTATTRASALAEIPLRPTVLADVARGLARPDVPGRITPLDVLARLYPPPAGAEP